MNSLTFVSVVVLASLASADLFAGKDYFCKCERKRHVLAHIFKINSSNLKISYFTRALSYWHN